MTSSSSLRMNLVGICVCVARYMRTRGEREPSFYPRKAHQEIPRPCIIHVPILHSLWLDPQVSKRPYIFSTKFRIAQRALRINFVAEQHLLRIVGANNCLSKRPGRQTHEMVGVGVCEEVEACGLLSSRKGVR